MNSGIRTAHEIRRAYVDFFLKRGHTEVPSAPLVPRGDPTLLFTSAGMVQFKDFYLDPGNLPYRRAVSVQKCLRAGDLESVGKTLRHHTFFEMLGNFSFGDYFKKEAIAWAWEFVVDHLQLPRDRLYVSIFEDDDEAFGIWNADTGVPAERIVRLGRKDNFWGPVGQTGVCGPCSEIYYDAGEARGCGSPDCAPGCDCDRYLEFWNLVFPQFFLDREGVYRPLEKPGIDTGAGLERIAMIMQGVEDNFHTNVFAPVVNEVIGRLPAGTAVGREERLDVNMIADHARALTFTIAEGIYPSNEGRGYILRRILRRALTRLHLFGVGEPFLSGLVGVVAQVMSDQYPELTGKEAGIAKIIRSEEESFFRTIEDGRGRFASIVSESREAGSDLIGGEMAFLLYDTYGFPLELTAALATHEGLKVDEEGFAGAMERQRRRAKEKHGFAAEGAEIVKMVPLSEGESSVFTGYGNISGEGELRSYRAIRKSDRKDIDWGGPGEEAVEIVMDSTPFYPTSGGQSADRGLIDIGGKGFAVRDVFKRGGETIHLVEAEDAEASLAEILRPGARASMRVDAQWRLATACNHTATHLLHSALRQAVGSHVAQAGSMVDGERLRFDFSHFEALSTRQKREIEEKVNGWARASLPVRTELMDYREAVASGAIALFDEKYGANVRVVKTGDVSVELCGGTHLDHTGRIGLFVIASESSVASGVRRIEALTGAAALALVHEMMDREEENAGLLRATARESAGRIRSILSELDDLKKELKKLERGGAGEGLDAIIRAAADVDGIRVATGRMPVKDAGALRNQADVFRGKVASGVAVLSMPLGGKMQYVVTVTDDLVARGIAADELVRRLGGIAGGGGGGKKHLAQLGTKEMDSEEKVFAALPGLLRGLIAE